MSTLVAGPLLVVLLFGSWLVVQRLWARSFGLEGEEDALSGRGGCTGCARADGCARPAGSPQVISCSRGRGDDWDDDGR